MSQSHRSEEALASASIGPLMVKLALPAVAAPYKQEYKLSVVPCPR